MVSKHLKSLLDSPGNLVHTSSSCVYPGFGQPVSFHLFDRRYLSYLNSIESPDRGLAGLLLSISIEI